MKNFKRYRIRLIKKIDYTHADETSLDKNKNYNEIIQLPARPVPARKTIAGWRLAYPWGQMAGRLYPIMNNTNTKKGTSAKDRHLNEHLAILERNMKRKIDDAIFGDIYTRYTLLVWQYGETKRAINFFEVLAKRHSQSPNALAALGTVTYGWRGQMVLQEGLDCIERAIELNGDNFFSKISHATFIAYFPNGFVKSMYEFSILRQTEEDSPQRLNLIKYRINHICTQHGHDGILTEYVEPVIKHRL